MRPRSNWNRRTFLGSVAALAGSLAAPKKLFASARDADRAVKSGFGHSGNPYEELGLTTVINCEGTMTMLGGSLPHPELEAVMMQAGRHFVSIPELEVAAGNKIAEMLKLPEQYNLPCMNDAAADTPPVAHLWDYANMGYDLITFSGGKAIRGPQCAGLLIGRKDLVANALLNNSPHEDTLGRSQKVGKEEIIGMIKALELFLSEDHDALTKEWQDRLERISRQIAKVPGVSTSFFVPEIANHVPHMQITWDSAHINLSPPDASKMLRSGKPSIVMGGGEGKPGLAMNSFMLQPGEEKIVAEQLVKLFKAHSA